VHILWSKDRIAEQHLEGDCRDLDKLKIEVRDFFGERLLRVQQVDSMSDGVLKIYVDISKES